MAVRAALAAAPAASIPQLATQTGAPPHLVADVRRLWKQRQEASS